MDRDFGTTTQILDVGTGGLPPRVLLVDDDELVRAHLQTLIGAAGFDVTTAHDAQSALAALEKDFTPVVITDRNMPGMDGLELCRTIRRTSWSGYVYLLLLTAHDKEEDILAGLEAGADDYLSKRASSAQLLARLRTAQRILSLERSLKAALDEKRRMAMTDSLTGAFNRRYFMRYLEHELQHARRFGGGLSVLALDIDHFKQVNDRYGHAAGDDVLCEFVRRIGGALPRKTDWCARMGGEEFVVVMGHTNLAGAAVAAEKVRAAVAATPVRSGSVAIPITVSIGVAVVPELVPKGSGPSMEALLNEADRNLYRSKENGRNRVTLPDASSDSPDTPITPGRTPA